MVGPNRPQIVLFGSSIVQFSYSHEGWGSILTDLYSCKADIVLRGYGGWNTRLALQVLDQIFPKDAAVQPSLVIVYFGGNDSMKPDPNGQNAHVPLLEYIQNMKNIVLHLKSLSEKTRILVLSTPPVNEEQIIKLFGSSQRSNESSHIYSEACIKMCQELGIKVIDLWTALQNRDDWLTAHFTYVFLS
uniref:Isoamyl acetate-hydrolyzing esterase n=1 Tax=Solanum tuberosum TaxID=4113 RepID=M1BNL9_SOLTU